MGACRCSTHIPLLRSVDSLHEVILPCLFFISSTFCCTRDEITRASTVEFTLPLLSPGPSMDLPLLLRVLLAFCASFNAASAASHCEYNSPTPHLQLHARCPPRTPCFPPVFFFFSCPFSRTLTVAQHTITQRKNKTKTWLHYSSFPLTSKWIGLDGNCSWKAESGVREGHMHAPPFPCGFDT